MTETNLARKLVLQAKLGPCIMMVWITAQRLPSQVAGLRSTTV